MKFQHWQMNLSAGDTIALTISRQCNVFLVDDANFSSFKRGSGFTHYGGFQKMKLVRIPVPRTGHWHLVLMPLPGNSVSYSQPRVI